MSSHHDDITPLNHQGYSQEPAPSTLGQSSSHQVQQKQGQFATSGTQPSFALELDISTIEHVCLFFFFLLKKYVNKNQQHFFLIGMVR